MITYKWIKLGIKKQVLLEGKYVGNIIRVIDGWSYFPKGQVGGGDAFPTLRQCEESLREKLE